MITPTKTMLLYLIFLVVSRFKRDVASNQLPESASNKNTGTSAGAGSGAGEMKEKCGGRRRRKAIGKVQ